MRNERRNIRINRKNLLNQNGNFCSICALELDARMLELHHIIPKIYGGESTVDNMMMLCPNCNRLSSKMGLRGYEFQAFVFQLLQKSKRYRDAEMEKPLDPAKNKSADIVVEENIDGTWRRVVIECKAQSSLSIDHLQKIMKQFDEWRKYTGDATLILAFPGQLSDMAREYVSGFMVEIWDMSVLADRFRDVIKEVYIEILQARVQSSRKQMDSSREEELIGKLRSCIPGKEHWSKYQNVVGEILETLFCPPLSLPLKESSDASKTNRRDFIFENDANEGYWAFLRNRYSADHIVVDAKNYSRKIKKQDVLQIANYLKPYGAGLFAIIVCRHGEDNGCLHTRREVWAYQNKMILVLTDIEIEQMLRNKSNDLPAVDVIKAKIRDFRLEL